MLPFRPELTWPADLYLGGQRPAPRLVPELAARRPRDARRGRRSAPCSPTASSSTRKAGRCRSRCGNTIEPQEIIARAAPRSSGCGRRWSTTARRSVSAPRSSRASSRRYRKLRNTCRDPRREPARLQSGHRRAWRVERAGARRSATCCRDCAGRSRSSAQRQLRRLRLPERRARAERVRRRRISARSTWTSRRTGSTRSRRSRRAAGRPADGDVPRSWTGWRGSSRRSCR